MNTILIHIGCTGPHISSPIPPSHLERCIEQYRVFNKEDLFILTDRENIPLITPRPGVFVLPLEDYRSDKLERFDAKFNYTSKEFWNASTARFFYLENFLRVHNLHHIVHFENDVLVYFDIEKYTHVFQQLYPTMATTPCDPDHLTSGFMYFNNYTALERMNDFFMTVLTQHGNIETAQKVLHIDMANDMTMMKRFADASGVVGILPALPFGEVSQGIELFDAIFDGAGWGQYIGGTQTNGPGISYAGHVVGAFIRAHPEWQVTWQVKDGLRLPYLCNEDKQVKINNLHIHSKNMRLFMSRANISEGT